MMESNGFIAVNEIFTSISGEQGLFRQGDVVSFLRLQGCNLSCKWCDAPQARYNPFEATREYSVLSFDEIISRLVAMDNKKVVITGGEPMCQGSQLYKLIPRLKDSGFKIQIETNGTFIIRPKVFNHVVFDYKISNPRNMITLAGFVEHRTATIKFVVESVQQIAKAIHVIFELEKTRKRLYASHEIRYCLSPVIGNEKNNLTHVDVLNYLTDHRLTKLISINAQLHKLLNLK